MYCSQIETSSWKVSELSRNTEKEREEDNCGCRLTVHASGCVYAKISSERKTLLILWGDWRKHC